ncbi:uncharacterized protein LOC101931677 isoform X1 [Chrysemys picta bellii]|uniref:uncharacterized protein LOC101931677 isoform X1 n=1 Tax=Chrysemys picta bellii TaxID=8478 RepID=UPI0032B1A827
MTTKEEKAKEEAHKRERELRDREEKAKEEAHKREMEIKEREEKAKKEAHEREMELEKAKEEAHKRTMELKEKEMKMKEKEMELKEKEMEEREKERKHELEVAKAKQDAPANANNPPPGTTSHPRKFPIYKAGDDTEAFLENFERACLGYSITADQYMVELRPQLSGPLAEVAAEMPKEHMNSYELFKNKARLRMGLTPEHARQRFRALKWKPDVSFTRHAYHIDKNCDAWVSGANVKSLEDLLSLVKMEQFLEGVPEEIERYILDRKPKTVTEAGEIGAQWVEVAEKKKTSSSWSEYQKGQAETKPYHRGQPKAPPTSQGKPRMPSHPTTPVSTNQPRPGDTLAGRCFKCNGLGHIKAHCPKNPNRLQFITPQSHQRSPNPDASLIPSERRETLRVGGKKVTAWRDTGAQVSTIHQSLVDPKLINPEATVTIQPFVSQSVTLPTATLHVQYKGWSGMWTFAVYDNYPIPMLLGEDLANHVKLAKRVGIVTRSQAKQAFTPIPVPEPSTRAPSVLPETQTKVVELDPLPTTATAVVDPIPETQPQPVPEPELATQPAPEPLPALSPALANPSTTPMPEGTSEPDLAEAADNPTQEAQPEPELPHSAPADSGSQSMETAPAPASLPEGPSPSPQSKEELMSPASREQFQAEQEADDSLQKAWAAARSTPPPLSSSNRSRFVVEQGLLYKETLSGGHQEDWHPQRQLVVPTKYRVKLLSLAHDHPSGHSGVNRTKDRLGKSFHWEGMGKDVANYVRSCEVCQRVGKPQDQVKAPLQPLPIIEVPFQRVAVDILGPFPKKTPRGKQYVLTFMDFATRWPEAVPLSNTRAKSVCQALTDIFARVGWPSDILTDSGTNFLAGTMENLWEAHGVNHLVATPYHHETNGLVERFNGTLGAMIRKFVNEHSNDWDLVLQQLLFAYRAVPHPSLGFSPFELVYGREVKGPLQLVKQQWEGFTPSPGTNILDFVSNLQNTLRHSLALAKENLKDAQEEQKAWYDKHSRERSFKVGDQVMVLKAIQAHKMEASWEGPFTVQERLGAVNYLIASPTSNIKPKVYHVNSLKPFFSRELNVCQFTAQETDDAEWPEGVYYEGKKDGGVEEVNLSMTLGRLQRQQIKELCTSFAPIFSATPGWTERAYHSIDTANDGTASKQEEKPQEGCLEKLEPHRTLLVKSEEEVLQSLQQGAAAQLASPTVIRMEQSTQCGRDFSLLKGFVVQPGEKPFACSECGKSFRLKGNLVKHLRSHAKVRPYKCTECEKSFNCQSDLLRHQMIHRGEKPYKCSECEKSYSRKVYLLNHQRVHTGERPFQCTACEKSFRQKAVLISHQRLHTGERPYKCTQCDNSFSEKSKLNNHFRIHTGEWPYKCTKCDKSYSRKVYLLNHQRLHTGERPFQCTACSKSFMLKTSFMKHQRNHVEERPHQGGPAAKSHGRSVDHQGNDPGEGLKRHIECGKSITGKPELETLQQVHVRERPHQCGACEKSFRYEESLREHQSLHITEQGHPEVSLSPGQGAEAGLLVVKMEDTW